MTREEAIEVLKKTVDNSVEMTMREWEEFDKLMVEAIDIAIEALSADAVEVVRCKDCKWAEKAILNEYCVECTMYHTSCMKHGYCHHGERREK